MALPPPVSLSQGRWRAELLEMSAPPGGDARCVGAHVCWPFYAGEVAARTGGVYFVDCVLGGVLAFFYCANGLFWAPTRSRLRQLHNIPGSLLEDCVVVTVLPCCYITQALNHLDIVDAEAAALRERLSPSAYGGVPAAMLMQAASARGATAPPPPLPQHAASGSGTEGHAREVDYCLLGARPIASALPSAAARVSQLLFYLARVRLSFAHERGWRHSCRGRQGPQFILRSRPRSA